VVEAAAAALASLSDEPMPAISAAAAANMSGTVITYDIVDLRLK
jgi:membrane protein YqaA with SNARE-associated domain